MTATHDSWTAGDAYEGYMGRWSRSLARAFIRWLAPPPQGRWLEVGCGTGALTSAICELAAPASVVASDPSEPFVDYARKTTTDARVSFVVAPAEAPPGRPGDFDWAVSGLALNFFADASRAVRLMRDRLRPAGVVAAYVWDYAEGVQFLRHFWDEAVAIEPGAAALDEGRRFPLCRPEALRALFVGAGLQVVAGEALRIPTRFRSFDDFWAPFLRGTGPAPAFVESLPAGRRDVLRDRLARRLTLDDEGGITLTARAWAMSGAK